MTLSRLSSKTLSQLSSQCTNFGKWQYPNSSKNNIPTYQHFPKSNQNCTNSLQGHDPSSHHDIDPTLINNLVLTHIIVLVSTLIDDIVPTFINDIVPTFINDIAPTFINDIVPTFINDIVPTFINDCPNSCQCLNSSMTSSQLSSMTISQLSSMTMSQWGVQKKPNLVGSSMAEVWARYCVCTTWKQPQKPCGSRPETTKTHQSWHIQPQNEQNQLTTLKLKNFKFSTRFGH